MQKRCEWCCKKPVVPPATRFCSQDCRLAWLHDWNLLHPPDMSGIHKKPLAEKHVNITINLTPAEASAAAIVGGASGKLPQNTRAAVRKGIKTILAERADDDNGDSSGG